MLRPGDAERVEPLRLSYGQQGMRGEGSPRSRRLPPAVNQSAFVRFKHDAALMSGEPEMRPG